MAMIRVSNDVHEMIREAAEKRGITMSSVVGELCMQMQEPHEDVIHTMRDDGELEGLESAWDRNYGTTVSCNMFTSRLLGLLVGSVNSRRVKDKKTYLEYLAVREYKRWCNV